MASIEVGHDVAIDAEFDAQPGDGMATRECVARCYRETESNIIIDSLIVNDAVVFVLD